MYKNQFFDYEIEAFTTSTCNWITLDRRSLTVSTFSKGFR